MKQCPTCKTTYADDSMSFCLNDGASLAFVPEPAETVRMSFSGAEPMRINVPPDSAPTVFAQPLIQQSAPAKKSFGLIFAGVLGVLLLLVIAGIAAAFVFFRQTGDKKPVVIASNVTPAPTVALTSTPNNDDETARLKEEMANLKRQLENQKNQKSNSSAETTSPPFARKTATTARANSPTDGFLALRSEPNSESGYRIMKIPHGATLEVLGCPKPSNVGKMPGRWCQVIYDGQAGWAFDAFMTF